MVHAGTPYPAPSSGPFIGWSSYWKAAISFFLVCLRKKQQSLLSNVQVKDPSAKSTIASGMVDRLLPGS